MKNLRQGNSDRRRIQSDWINKFILQRKSSWQRRKETCLQNQKTTHIWIDKEKACQQAIRESDKTGPWRKRWTLLKPKFSPLNNRVKQTKWEQSLKTSLKVFIEIDLLIYEIEVRVRRMKEVSLNWVNDLWGLSSLSNRIDQTDQIDQTRVYEAEWVKHQNLSKIYQTGLQAKQ